MELYKVKQQLANLLRRWPTMHRLTSKVYLKAYHSVGPRRLKEYLLGTRVREKWWATRHLRKSQSDDWGKGSNDWIKGYWNSINHSHRSFLMERMSNFSPIHSILEIGCNCGPNLFLIAKTFPNIKIIRGIDINPTAVQKGNEWLAQEGFSNVLLSVGKADELGQFEDKSFDVVFTDAILIYIGPDKIKGVLKEMSRIARRALILVEWHFNSQGKDPSGFGAYHLGYWKRDYAALLKQFVQEEQIRIIKIPEELWGGQWANLGCVIEVLL